MYAVGIVGLALGLMALFAALFMGGPEPAALTAHHRAQNYAIAQGAVQQAVLVAAGQAKNWAAGTPLLTGSACLTPLTRATECDILLGTGQSAEITAQLPPHWQVLTETPAPPTSPTSRWQGRIQGGILYVYGAMSHEEMAALREVRGTAPNLAFCTGGAASSGGDACLPPLREQMPDGTMQALPLPPAVATAANTTTFAVHATRIVQ